MGSRLLPELSYLFIAVKAASNSDNCMQFIFHITLTLSLAKASCRLLNSAWSAPFGSLTSLSASRSCSISSSLPHYVLHLWYLQEGNLPQVLQALGPAVQFVFHALTPAQALGHSLVHVLSRKKWTPPKWFPPVQILRSIWTPRSVYFRIVLKYLDPL